MWNGWNHRKPRSPRSMYQLREDIYQHWRHLSNDWRSEYGDDDVVCHFSIRFDFDRSLSVILRDAFHHISDPIPTDMSLRCHIVWLMSSVVALFSAETDELYFPFSFILVRILPLPGLSQRNVWTSDAEEQIPRFFPLSLWSDEVTESIPRDVYADDFDLSLHSLLPISRLNLRRVANISSVHRIAQRNALILFDFTEMRRWFFLIFRWIFLLGGWINLLTGFQDNGRDFLFRCLDWDERLMVLVHSEMEPISFVSSIESSTNANRFREAKERSEREKTISPLRLMSKSRWKSMLTKIR